MCVCVCVCVCVCARARGHALRIVSADKTSHFLNIIIVIIILLQLSNGDNSTYLNDTNITQVPSLEPRTLVYYSLHTIDAAAGSLNKRGRVVYLERGVEAAGFA